MAKTVDKKVKVTKAAKAAPRAAAKTHKVSRSATKRPHPIHLGAPLVLFVGLTLLLTAAVVILTRTVNRQSAYLANYQLTQMVDNQACRYLDHQPEVNGSFDLTLNSPKGQAKLTYTCSTGVTIPGKGDGFEATVDKFGTKVQYFGTREEAYSYAEHTVNPTRYWGVDQEGQKNNIPQTSLFTFLVQDKQQPYFDAYTVKANAVLRITLPCDSKSQTDGAFTACQSKAEKMLNREMKGIDLFSE